jgi:hypothetical protein
MKTTRHRNGLPLLLLLLVGGAATATHAMVVVPAEFNEMVASSQTIVHGRVVDVRPYETAGRRTIETLVTVQVVEALKGDAGSTVHFKLPGGQVGRYRRVMIGVPQSAPGDEVVLFLKGSAPAVPMPFGLTQGFYRVNRDASGRPMVMPPVSSERMVRGDPARRPITLETFITLVRSVAGARP